jgi:hypothetical protein
VALGDPYATPAQLETRLGRADDGRYTNALAAATNHVNGFCRRQFNKTTTAAARTFEVVDACTAIVDDFHTVTDLVIKTDDNDDATFETTWVAADYELEPFGGVVDGETGWPFYWVKAVGSKRFPTSSRRKAVLQVTAQWGWAAVPPLVVEATLDEAEAIIAKEQGMVVAEAIDGYSTTYGRTLSPRSKVARYVMPGGFA